MGRKKHEAEKDLRDAIANVFVGEHTTIAERAWLAEQWSHGDHETYVRVAGEKGLTPIALILASLVDSEHPVLCPNGNLCTASFVGFAAILLRIETRQMMTGAVASESGIREMVDSFHSLSHRTVENSTKPVDNIVDKPVETMILPVDNPVERIVLSTGSPAPG